MGSPVAINWNSTESDATVRADDMREDAADPVIAAVVAVRQASTRLTHVAQNAAPTLEDIIEQALKIDQAVAPHLDVLWMRCIRANDETIPEQLSINARRFCFALTDLYVSCVRQVMRAEPAAGIPRALLLVRAMHAVRVLFQWQWLRYEIPSERYWKMAAYIHECAKRESRSLVLQRLYRHAPDVSSVASEYYATRFIDWVGPSSLSAKALDSFARAGSGCLRERHQDNQSVALSGWIMQLQKRVASWQNPQSNPPAVQVVQSETPLPAGRPPQFELKAEAGDAVGRVGFVMCNFSSIVASEAMRDSNGKTGRQDSARTKARQCMVRVSNKGCRISVRGDAKQGMRIGALLEITPAQSKTPVLGVIRWLKRDENGSGEAGVETLKGNFSAFSAVSHHETRTYPATTVSILIADQPHISGRGVLTAILPKGRFMTGKPILIQSPTTALKKFELLESGYDFDIAELEVDVE